MKHIIIFNIFYILFNLNIFKSEIIIPFMRAKSLENNSNFIEYIIYNNIYVTIPIGNPTQLIKFNVTMESSSISITSFNNYNYKDSNSYYAIEDEKEIYKYKYKNGFEATDNFLIDNKQCNFSFLFVTEMLDDEDIILGEIGLKIYEQNLYNKMNIILQLKQLNLINSYAFGFQYTDEYKGNLILGINYNKDEYNIINNGIENIYDSYNIKFNHIFIGNEIELKYIKVGVIIDFFGFIGTQEYLEIIKNKFFNPLLNEKKCFIVNDEKEDSNFFYIKCQKNIDLKKFPNLSFLSYDLKMYFNFTYQELFKLNNDFYYFLIVFRIFDDNHSFWKLGEIFFRKYNLLFDLDKKIIGFPIIKSNYQKNEINNKKEKSRIYKIFIIFLNIILICTILFLILLLLLLIKKKKIKNRIKEINNNYFSLINNDN